ncbi:hypothetical protein NKR23_g7128 [Pleurostoma richardsiae]|uniref:Uncharacterized protein n=1 Tax=Pleurostoma richardsiae TaxID=41990 RepID=A0AA38VNB3_9PEZI|nr:hypothetical protein NKR23_g7128 [Pleurostoma richardsiae]
MKRAFGLAAFGCVLNGIEAKTFKWSQDGLVRRWQPAQETDLGIMPVLGLSPLPTEPPRLEDRAVFKRSTTDNTCAYVSGDADVPLYCGTDSSCIFNSFVSKIGCCGDGTSATDCRVFTTCYDSTDVSSFSSYDSAVVYCGSSEYPYCRTHIYEDDLFSGYTLYGCAKTGGSDFVDYTTSKSTSSSSSSSESSEFSESTTSTSTTSVDPVIATVTVPAATSTSASPKKSTPVGAIVGGVVGGVGGLALIGLGAFFLWRHSKKKDSAAAAPPPAAPGNFPPSQPSYAPQGPQPPMAQHYQQAPPPPGYAGFAPVQDNRMSMQKPPYAMTSTAYDPNGNNISPPASPPPQGGSPHSPSVSGYSPTAQSYAQDPSQQQQQYPNQPVHYQNPAYPQTSGGFAHELPTTKPDGQLHELS